MTKSFDMIIVGAGASGLMLADAISNDPHFRGQSVLLLEKNREKGNDRTWCFWEEGGGDFDSLVSKQWDILRFRGKNYDANCPIAPYTYKMVRGIDFYSDYHNRLANYPNISLEYGQVTHIREDDEGVSVFTRQVEYRAPMVFNSILDWTKLGGRDDYPLLQQHFLGWFISSETPVFDPEAATFMDFSVPQNGNTRFMYILPFSDREALVEYTLFSGQLLPAAEYESALENYMTNTLHCVNYTILAKEQGRIPMTSYNFTADNTARIMNIGAAGGWAKPSTGFTFMNSHRQTKALVAHLKTKSGLRKFAKKRRFWWYDLLLLDILAKDNSEGGRLFEALFRNRKAVLILRFLEEKTNLWEDLYVICACPKGIFFRALLRRLRKSLRY